MTLHLIKINLWRIIDLIINSGLIKPLGNAFIITKDTLNRKHIKVCLNGRIRLHQNTQWRRWKCKLPNRRKYLQYIHLPKDLDPQWTLSKIL